MAQKNDIFSGDAALRYDSWYERPKGRRMAALEKQALMEMIEPVDEASLLDVGCGTGYFGLFFSRMGLRVTGVDISQSMLAVARKKGGGIQLVRGDAHRLPFAASTFDVVTIITTLEFVQDPGAVLRECHRVARRAIVLGVLNRLSWLSFRRKLRGGGLFSRAKFYSVRQLKELIRRSLGDVNVVLRSPFRAFVAVLITSGR